MCICVYILYIRVCASALDCASAAAAESTAAFAPNEIGGGKYMCIYVELTNT